MLMELQKITKWNITRTTGLLISELLGKKPVENTRLKKLKRQQSSESVDLLIRGNPQLTVGRVTTIEAVDAYFDKKNEKQVDTSEH